MLSSGEKDSEIGDAVPGRGNLATSSGFISWSPVPAESGILADESLGAAGRACPLKVKASAPPTTAAPTVVARRRTTCIRWLWRADNGDDTTRMWGVL